MTALSAVLGRKVFFNRGYYVLYPNFFTVLVAGSARCRKSTAIGIAVDLLRSVDSVRILAGKTSPERFIGDCRPAIKGDSDTIIRGEEQPLLVHADELSVLLTKDSQGDKLIDLLTKLFDCPKKFEYRTWKHDAIILHNVFITILAGTTQDGLPKCLPDSAFGGGFASRILFVCQEDTTRRNALPVLTPEEIELREELSRDMEKLSLLQGEFRMTKDARTLYTEWYDGIIMPEDKRLQGYYGRKHDHVLRVSMVMSASQGDFPIIDARHIDAALAALGKIEKTYELAFQDLGTGNIKMHVERVVMQMKKYKRIAHSDLLRKNYHYLDGVEFRKVMDMLIDAKLVGRDQYKQHIYVWLGDDATTKE